MNLIDLVAICPFYISLILEVADFIFMDMIDHKNTYISKLHFRADTFCTTTQNNKAHKSHYYGVKIQIVKTSELLPGGPGGLCHHWEDRQDHPLGEQIL